MPTATLATVASLAGLSIQSTLSRTADIAAAYNPETPLPAAKAGSLTTRTDNDTGVVTLSTGHGITTGMVVDVYWADGCRYGMTATVSVNAVTVDGGEGDNLPAQATAVTLAEQVDVDLPDFDGDLLEMLAIYTARRAHVDFREAAATALARTQPAGEVYSWAADSGVTNPLANTVVETVKVSNGDSAGTCVVKIGLLLNAE